MTALDRSHQALLNSQAPSAELHIIGHVYKLWHKTISCSLPCLSQTINSTAISSDLLHAGRTSGQNETHIKTNVTNAHQVSYVPIRFLIKSASVKGFDAIWVVPPQSALKIHFLHAMTKHHRNHNVFRPDAPGASGNLTAWIPRCQFLSQDVSKRELLQAARPANVVQTHIASQHFPYSGWNLNQTCAAASRFGKLTLQYGHHRRIEAYEPSLVKTSCSCILRSENLYLAQPFCTNHVHHWNHCCIKFVNCP